MQHEAIPLDSHVAAAGFPGLPDPLTRFVALEKERRELETRLEEIKHDAAALADLLLDEWADRGQQSANVDGLSVYIAQEFYCTKRSGVDTETLVELLKANGLGRVVTTTYNAASLKAFVKEQLAEGSDLAEPLKACLSYDTVPRLRTRKG